MTEREFIESQCLHPGLKCCQGLCVCPHNGIRLEESQEAERIRREDRATARAYEVLAKTFHAHGDWKNYNIYHRAALILERNPDRCNHKFELVVINPAFSRFYECFNCGETKPISDELDQALDEEENNG